MSPGEIMYLEQHRKDCEELARIARERTLHRWVAEGKVVYNITRQRYTVGCDAHAVIFLPEQVGPFPTEHFIAAMALAIQSLPCRPVPANGPDPICGLGKQLTRVP